MYASDRPRKSQWLRIWLWPMLVVAVFYVAGMVANAVLAYDGWWVVDWLIAGMLVFTVAANMWMAWEATAPIEF